MKRKNNLIMKFSLMLVFMLSLQLINAQGMGGRPGGGRPGMQDGQRPGGAQRPGGGPQMKAFDFLEMAGIINYSVADVIEETKVKEGDVKAKVEEAFVAYNDSLHRIGFMHPESFMYLQEANGKIKGYMETQNREAMMQLMRGSQEHIQIIRPVAQRYEQQLNASLGAVLSKKEMDRWTKYMEEIKKAKMPQMGGARGGRR